MVERLQGVRNVRIRVSEGEGCASVHVPSRTLHFTSFGGSICANHVNVVEQYCCEIEWRRAKTPPSSRQP